MQRRTAFECVAEPRRPTVLATQPPRSATATQSEAESLLITKEIGGSGVAIAMERFPTGLLAADAGVSACRQLNAAPKKVEERRVPGAGGRPCHTGRQRELTRKRARQWLLPPKRLLLLRTRLLRRRRTNLARLRGRLGGHRPGCCETNARGARKSKTMRAECAEHIAQHRTQLVVGKRRIHVCV